MATGWIGSAIVRTCGAGWSSAITMTAPAVAKVAAARAARYPRRGSVGAEMVGVWSGMAVSWEEWWLGRPEPSTAALAPRLRGAHTRCERA